MATISLCMIVKNEALTLGRCLEQVKDFADEIIIVDTGSTDTSKEIALHYTKQVYDFHWKDDFAAARNFSFSKATMDYCMWLDADDVILPKEQQKLIEFKDRLDFLQADVVMLPYDVSFNASGQVQTTYMRERIIKNTKQALWMGRVHEVITPFGNIIHEDIHIRHEKIKPYDTDRNLRIYETMQEEGCILNAREQFYYARELYYHAKYNDAIIAFQKFLSMKGGWIENKIEAHRQMAECYGQIGDSQSQLQALLQSFALDLPRAETCCAIGQIYFEQGNWKAAAFWYETALRVDKNTQSGGFVQESCYGYLPCMQLCVCYDKMGEYEKAESYNEMGAVFQPKSEAVRYNRNYFLQRRTNIFAEEKY